MPINEKRAYLLCYDIASPKRLGRVHRWVSKRGIAVQYSVYYFICTDKTMEKILGTLRTMIHRYDDDIRVYTLPRDLSVKTVGKLADNKGVHYYAGLPTKPAADDGGLFRRLWDKYAPL